MKLIILTQGRVAQVDDEDYRFLSPLNWSYSQGYARRGSPFGTVLLHREVIRRMGLVIPPGHCVDHMDRDKLNDQRDNLRIVTASQNVMNVGLKANSGSTVVGVSWDQRYGKWYAGITVKGSRLFLGRFARFEDAVAKRRAAEERFFPDEPTNNNPLIATSA